MDSDDSVPLTGNDYRDTTRRLTARGLSQDALAYIELTQAGRLYEYLMQQEGVPRHKRAEFKRAFFGGVFFCEDRPLTKQAKLFKKHFPSVYRVGHDIKADDSRHLAHVLQRTESSPMINRVARRCMGELPDVCVVTVHDSVLTTPEGGIAGAHHHGRGVPPGRPRPHYPGRRLVRRGSVVPGANF